MDDVKTLTPIPALYDFVLYFECASKDWIEGAKKNSIKGDGNLVNLINWNSTYSYDPNDKGGKTLFGVTESTWHSFVSKYPNKGYSKDLNTMGKQGWFEQMDWYWSEKSSAGKCANYACAFLMFQMVWVGFNANAQKTLLDTLKLNADISNYNFIESGNTYRKIADATHAYKDPMVAYDYMRKSVSSYYYNISTPEKTNKVYRMGWLNRSALSFTPYGLYVPTTMDGKAAGLEYSSTLDEWESTAIRLAQNNTKGYVKIVDWGKIPETEEKISENQYAYEPYSQSYPNNFLGGYSNTNNSQNGSSYQTNSSDNSLNTTNQSNSINSSNFDSGNNCGSVSKLGNYSNSTRVQTKLYIDGGGEKQAQTSNKSRESVLSILLEGSYTPNDVNKCSKLTTSDKLKG